MKKITYKNFKLICDKNSDRAIMELYENNRFTYGFHVSLTAPYFPVFKAFGNKVYKDCKNNPRLLECFSVLTLDYSVLCEDYDGYSDSYKDEYCVRPHLTETEWKALVKDTKKKYNVGE